MPSVMALIPTDLERGRLGHARSLGDDLGGVSVLERTVRRALSVEGVEGVALVHPAGQDPLSVLSGEVSGRVKVFVDEGGLRDGRTQRLVSARKWSPGSWRGGLGFATGFDELLPPGPLAKAAGVLGADSVLLVRGDWPLFDVGYAGELIRMHLQSPDSMKLTLTQAPPGLGPLVLLRSVLEEMAEHDGWFGPVLGYNSQSPTIDPIGREVTLPIDPGVRDCAYRFVYDTAGSVERLRAVADVLGDGLDEADAGAVTEAWRGWERAHPGYRFERLPQQVNLEVTPERAVKGPITPQAYVDFERGAMDEAVAGRIMEQLGAAGDVSLLIGGLGDPLLHPGWKGLVEKASEAGVFGIGLETDLQADWEEVSALLDLPLDLVIVQINADRGETYEKVMGGSFSRVAEHLQRLFRERKERRELDGRGDQVPWIVPRLVKTAETLKDMESFFERWVRGAGYAMIAPSCSGCGLMPELSPVPMEPPLRKPCVQLGRRMSILSDGTVALCDQDWLGRAALGNAGEEDLSAIWGRAAEAYGLHQAGRYQEVTICGQCREWHRP